MTEYQRNQEAKARLFAQYQSTIEEVQRAYEDYTEEYAKDLQARWPAWLDEHGTPSWKRREWRTRLETSYGTIYADDWVVDYDEEDPDSSGLMIVWQPRIQDKRIRNEGIKHKLLVKGADDELQKTFRERYQRENVQERISDCIAAIDSTERMTASQGAWEGRKSPLLVEGEYRFELFEEPFETAFFEVFESLQPIFSVVSECMPERAE